MAIAYNIPKLTDKDFATVRRIVYDTVGINLTEQKRGLVVSRLSKRLKALNMKGYDEYLKFAEQNPEEIVSMFNAISTNVTSFFREEHHFIYLTETFLPELVEATVSGEKRFRAWSAGCSTGEEPYTLAIFLNRYFENKRNWKVSILASDINTEALEKASKGVYNRKEVSGVPYELLKRYFRLGRGDNEGMFKAKDQLRSMITFRRVNLTAPQSLPTNMNLDVIFCRNVFIYFDRETRAKVLALFHRHLKPGGLLFIGHSESINRDDDKQQNWQTLRHTIYQKK